LLVSHEVAVVTGEQILDASVSDTVHQRIAQTDGTIALLTRREELEAGGWTTHPWVVDELHDAQLLGKPAVALVEEGVDARGLSGETQVIAYRSGDPAEALLELSGVIGLWKSRAGVVLKARIQPPEVAETLFGAARSVFRYRVFLEGDLSEWRAATPIIRPGAVLLYLAVPRQGAMVQVEVSDGRTTWLSAIVPDLVPIDLLQV